MQGDLLSVVRNCAVLTMSLTSQGVPLLCNLT